MTDEFRKAADIEAATPITVGGSPTARPPQAGERRIITSFDGFGVLEGPDPPKVIAAGLSRTDADLLAHGLERIAELEAALADMFAALDRYGRQIDDLFGHDEQFIAAEDAARAALTRKEESR